MTEPPKTIPDDSPLFATEPVVEASTPPVIVVGLPRSGSSFLSHVLSSLGDWYVFDDLYLYQQVRALGAEGPLTPEQLCRLVGFLGWTVRARIRFEDSFFKPDCTWEDVDRMVEAVLDTYRDRPVTWPELVEEWLMRLARHHGRTRWGYKTPQDFLHMRALAEVFPGVRYLFIMRDPRKMMASMKYVRAEDGDPRQYHPIPYALYWKMAYRAVNGFTKDGNAPVLPVRFEELVAAPDAEAERIAAFLESPKTGPVPVRGKNTSFGKGVRKDITETERYICERLAGPLLVEAGYEPSGARFRVRDVPHLAWLTLRFGVYQLVRIVKRPDARHSVKAFLRRLVGRR
jgi:hypothetical protein